MPGTILSLVSHQIFVAFRWASSALSIHSIILEAKDCVITLTIDRERMDLGGCRILFVIGTSAFRN